QVRRANRKNDVEGAKNDFRRKQAQRGEFVVVIIKSAEVKLHLRRQLPTIAQLIGDQFLAVEIRARPQFYGDRQRQHARWDDAGEDIEILFQLARRAHGARYRGPGHLFLAVKPLQPRRWLHLKAGIVVVLKFRTERDDPAIGFQRDLVLHKTANQLVGAGALGEGDDRCGGERVDRIAIKSSHDQLLPAPGGKFVLP